MSECNIYGINEIRDGICLSDVYMVLLYESWYFKVLYMCISSRVEMECLLKEPAALVSNKSDCPYCGPLLETFFHISALTLQNKCNNARYVYFRRLHRSTPFVLHR
jgi:hypothetical protein